MFVFAYFEPHKLFIDDRVAEALPSAAGAPPSATESPSSTATTETPAVRTLSQGAFRSYEHATSGRARVIALADGERYVRFEDFETSNGPALKVYLSAAPASGPGDSFDDRFVDLGDLKGNIGSQNYAIPGRRAPRPLPQRRRLVQALQRALCGGPAMSAPLKPLIDRVIVQMRKMRGLSGA